MCINMVYRSRSVLLCSPTLILLYPKGGSSPNLAVIACLISRALEPILILLAFHAVPNPVALRSFRFALRTSRDSGVHVVDGLDGGLAFDSGVGHMRAAEHFPLSSGELCPYFDRSLELHGSSEFARLGAHPA